MNRRKTDNKREKNSRIDKQLSITNVIRFSNCLPFASTWVHPRFFWCVRVAHYFSFLCCLIMLWVWCYEVCYDFRIKAMFGSSLPQIVSRSLIYAICACLRLAVFNTFSFSGLSIFRYFLTFIYYLQSTA